MKTRWFRGLPSEATKDIKQSFKASTLLRARLHSMLLDIIEERRKGQVQEALYDNPNWSYLQADRTGYERAVRDIIELIQE